MQKLNTRFVIHFIWLMLFFLSVWKVPAQEQLDLEAYLELVAKENLDLKESYGQIRIAKQDVKAARSELLPDIGANANYQRDFNPTFLFINDFTEFNQFRTNFNNNVDAGILVNQTLFDAAIFSGFKIVKLSQELSMINHENASRELIFEASRLYWQAVLTRESIAVFEENSNLAQEQFEQIQKLYDKGMVSSLDLQRARVYHQQTKPLVNNAQNQYSALLNEMKSMANIDFDTTLILTDSLHNVTHLKTELDADNLNLQPQIRAVQKELEMAEKQISLKKAYWLPRISLSGGFNYNAQDNNFRFSNNSNELFFGTISLTVPIFSSGRNKAAIAKAQLQKKMIQFSAEKTRNQLEKELMNARNHLASALERIALQQETTDLNAKEIDVFRKQLQLGVVTPLEFKESRVRWTQSKLELLNAHLELLVARLQLRRILGTTNRTDIKSTQ